MRYSLKYSQKRLYYDEIKLNATEMKSYASRIMVQFLCGKDFYEYKNLCPPKLIIIHILMYWLVNCFIMF